MVCLSSQEADKHEKELVEKEERRKEKLEKNKQKKMVSIRRVYPLMMLSLMFLNIHLPLASH